MTRWSRYFKFKSGCSLQSCIMMLHDLSWNLGKIKIIFCVLFDDTIIFLCRSLESLVNICCRDEFSSVSLLIYKNNTYFLSAWFYAKDAELRNSVSCWALLLLNNIYIKLKPHVISGPVYVIVGSYIYTIYNFATVLVSFNSVLFCCLELCHYHLFQVEMFIAKVPT